MVACDNMNLCAGFPAGIEGAVHAVQAAWERVMTPEEVPGKLRWVQEQKRSGKNEAMLAEVVESVGLGTPAGGTWSIRMWYRLKPVRMPAQYKGCSKPFTMEHEPSCKVRWLVGARHDDIK